MVSTGSRLEHPGLRGENPGPMFTAFLSSWFTACGLGVNPCQAPAPSGHDPVIRDGHFNLTGLASLDVGLLVHLLDLATDPEEGRLYGSGTGGLWAFDMEGEGGLVYRGGFREDIADTYSRVAVLQDGLVAVLDRSTIAITAPDRDNRFNGVRILDVRDPEAITQVGMVSLSDVSYLDAVEDTLFVLRHQGLLEVYELSNPAVPVLVATMTGLGNPRSMTRPDEEGWVFVADGELGLVPVDLSDPFAPVLQEPVPTAGSPVDIERTANQVFVALGSDGLESFQYAGSELQSLGVQDSGGMALSGWPTWMGFPCSDRSLAHSQRFTALRPPTCFPSAWSPSLIVRVLPMLVPGPIFFSSRQTARHGPLKPSWPQRSSIWPVEPLRQRCR